MPYIVIEDFRGGFDTRRPAIAATPGSLQVLKNAHITRGGDIEKRKAMVSHKTLPAGETFGFASVAGVLYVFGSAAAPAVPSGVTYQRLQHPDGLDMTEVISWTISSGKLYVVAEYSDGRRLHFYDGVLVGDWINGVVRASFTDNAGTAAHLAGLINAANTNGDVVVSATSTGSVITVTSDENVAFDISTYHEDGGGTDDQTLNTSTTQTARADLDEELATCSFQVINGVEDAACKVTDITVNGVSVMTAADVLWTGTNEYTAQLIADSINSHTSTPDYTAVAEGTTVIITAAAGTGNTPNGYALQVTVGEQFITNIGSFEITGGTNNPGVNRIASVSVDGGAITSGTIDWATSNSATAAAVAANIRAASSTYTAYADGATVHVGKLVSDNGSPNNLTLSVTHNGDITIGGDETSPYQTKINTTCTEMSGGVDFVAGQPQITTLTVGGTFEVGDKFTITIDDFDVGASAVAGESAETVLTHKQKVYALFGSTMAFSGVAEPTLWNRNVTGAGQIDMSSQAAGAEVLTAIGVYQSELAVFARRTIQREYVDVDPDSNTLLQTINNFGTVAPHSIASFGESDVFFLADNGIRSLRARDSSNTAAISDIGTPIDPAVITLMNSLTEAQIAAARGVIEPEDGRYLLAINDRVFVFSFFPVSKISAWSEYDFEFTVDEWVTADNRLYARAGDIIYIYGGADNATYDDCDVEIILPFMDGRKPADFKNWNGYDIALTGEWTLEVAFDPNASPTVWETIGIASESSYDLARHGMAGRGPFIALRLTHSKANQSATITNVAFNYTAGGVV